MSEPAVVQADLTWRGAQFERDVQIAIAPDGRIDAVGRLGKRPTRRLRQRALLPGFVNTHSHAFQRGLRGRGERFPQGAGSFWTWRASMYELVERLDAETFSRLCRLAFEEMLDAGITTVGEFHYLHHSRNGSDNAFDHLVLQAAAEAGIRIVLLNAYYATGGVGRSLEGAQRRFASRSPSDYWRQMDRLAAALDPRTQNLGGVAHSIRAASLDDIVSLHREAARRQLVFHLHVEEQQREVDECLEAYGRRPLSLLNDAFDGAGNVTAVHCTHADPADLARFLKNGGGICVCPLTEANLGDGIPALGSTRGLGHRLSLGTDSNARVSLVEEMRWLEYGQRLRSQTRGVLAQGGQVAGTLLEAATAGGAEALGIDTGRIEAGRWADFVVIDLHHRSLAECGPDSLLEAIVFGAGDDVITESCVGGRWRERGTSPPSRSSGV